MCENETLIAIRNRRRLNSVKYRWLAPVGGGISHMSGMLYSADHRAVLERFSVSVGQRTDCFGVTVQWSWDRSSGQVIERIPTLHEAA